MKIAAVKAMDSSSSASSTFSLLDDIVKSFMIRNFTWSLDSNYYIYGALESAIITVIGVSSPSFMGKVQKSAKQ